MANITLSIEESLIKAGREYAAEQETSLNALIRASLRRQIGLERDPSSWAEALIRQMDECGGASGRRQWTRDGLYDA